MVQSGQCSGEVQLFLVLRPKRSLSSGRCQSVIGDWVSWLFPIVPSPICGIWGDAGSKGLDRFLGAIYVSGCSSGKEEAAREMST